MNKTIKAMAFVALALTFIGCASMPVVSGPVMAGGSKVEAQASNINILGFITPMSAEKAGEATKELAGKCSGREVVGVTSHWKTMYLWLVQMETLTVSGYCKE